MSENTKIEWCDHTFNPWTGCTKVSPGCANCYAEGWANRYGIVKWGPGAPRRRTSAANWKLPVKWNLEAERKRVRDLHSWPAGKPMPDNRPRVFCASLADWLDDEVPVDWLADLLCLIRSTPHLDWLLLTKRPENWQPRLHAVLHHLSEQDGAFTVETQANDRWWHVQHWLDGDYPHNIWLGTTVENQDMADKRIPQLLRIPAKVRFLSCEPLLERVDLWGTGATRDNGNGIDWLICGGESGPRARAMHPDWARFLRDQCQAANVPYFFKQMGGIRKPFAPIPDDINIRQFPTQ